MAGDCAIPVLEERVADMLAAMDNAKALGSGLSILIEVVCSDSFKTN